VPGYDATLLYTEVQAATCLDTWGGLRSQEWHSGTTSFTSVSTRMYSINDCLAPCDNIDYGDLPLTIYVSTKTRCLFVHDIACISSCVNPGATSGEIRISLFQPSRAGVVSLDVPSHVQGNSITLLVYSDTYIGITKLYWRPQSRTLE